MIYVGQSTWAGRLRIKRLGIMPIVSDSHRCSLPVRSSGCPTSLRVERGSLCHMLGSRLLAGSSNDDRGFHLAIRYQTTSFFKSILACGARLKTSTEPICDGPVVRLMELAGARRNTPSTNPRNWPKYCHPLGLI